jgi:hypothetical protein
MTRALVQKLVAYFNKLQILFVFMRQQIKFGKAICRTCMECMQLISNLIVTTVAHKAIVAVRNPKTCHRNFVVSTHVQLPLFNLSLFLERKIHVFAKYT